MNTSDPILILDKLADKLGVSTQYLISAYAPIIKWDSIFQCGLWFFGLILIITLLIKWIEPEIQIGSKIPYIGVGILIYMIVIGINAPLLINPEAGAIKDLLTMISR